MQVLSGAEDALANSKLDVVGAPVLESLVLFDVSCGCWCYNKPGHGIPPRLLSSPAPCLRSLTVVGFVVHQCTNLHALSLLTCLEELVGRGWPRRPLSWRSWCASVGLERL